MLSRASLCEILAMKLFARFGTDQLHLAAALTASWSPLAGAPPNTIDEVREAVGQDEHLEDPQCALEVSENPIPFTSAAHHQFRWQ